MAAIPLCTYFVLLFLLPHLRHVSPATQEDLLITTKHGKVQGKLLSVAGGEVRAFLGIPYGKPPLGKLRFRPPEPVEGWQGVKDATKLPNTCIQAVDTLYPGFSGAEMWNPNTPQSEDCLYLNVWAPRHNKTQPQTTLTPVLVWIYGGGFAAGTSSLDIYNGRFLSRSEGVIVVSMNYRLGPLGFLSLPNSKTMRGNAGLLDQRLALQWVANNIAAFGGDSSKVTLFGESAGSASVGFQLISPGSQPLFHRAVMQSGSPNAFWATLSHSEADRRAKHLATLMGCPTSPQNRLETCLQQADPLKMSVKQFEVLPKPVLVGLPFAPTVDGNFLPDEVEVLLSNGKLPKKELMLGLNKDEGTYFLMYGAPGFNLSQNLISRSDFLQGLNLAMADAHDVERETAIFQYTNWMDIDNSIHNRDSLGSLVGDQMFFCPLLEFARRYSQVAGKTFLYYFDHRSSVNPWPEWMGVMHGYEIEFVFGIPLDPSLGYTKNEVNMTKRFMKHWANFARTGDPGLEGSPWPVFTPESQEYLTLNSHQPEKHKFLRAKECHLWNKLMPKLNTVSDNLLLCQNGSGTTLSCNYVFLLILLALALTLSY